MTSAHLPLDSVARQIAADAGIAWRELSDFPGFSKGRWRDEARWLINNMVPLATVVEARRQWNGKTGEDIVANLSDEDVDLLLKSGRLRLRSRAG